jgi:hypothetical protein
MKTFKSFLTGRFDLALQFAAGLHQAQCRKGTKIPYISHLLSVSALVLEVGGDEDQAIAALLHDAVEDQGGQPTLDTIRRLFGDRVHLPWNLARTASRATPPRSCRGKKERRITLPICEARTTTRC